MPPLGLTIPEEMFMVIRLQVRRDVATRLLFDDRGQDLIEYALLTAIIGISGLLIFSTISTKMGAAYSGWNAAGQNAWQPCPPKPAACP
jgi:Flp pilus assembly pilin Flp